MHWNENGLTEMGPLGLMSTLVNITFSPLFYFYIRNLIIFFFHFIILFLIIFIIYFIILFLIIFSTFPSRRSMCNAY